MVALLCFCCDHCNPADAKFCNACGTPLHLKPCRHCEAINARAAAHCHQCGETLACDFLTPLAAAPMPDQPDAAGVQTGVYAIETPSQSRWRTGLRTRAAVILLVLTATVMLSAYYAYQQPDIGSATGAMVERPPSGIPLAPFLSDAAPAPASGPSNLAPTTGSSDRPGGDRLGPETNASVAFDGASPPKASAARVRAVNTTSPAKPKAHRVARSRGAEAPATKLSIVDRDIGARSPLDGGSIAVQQTVAASQPPRIAAPIAAPIQRPREVARRPAPTPAIGAWDRPCAEGVALESTCDVRMMPKGN